MSAPDPTSYFAQKTDAELLYLAQHAQRYPAAVAQAAVQELQRRGLIPEELPQGPPVRPQPSASPDLTGWAFLRQISRGVFWPRPGYFVTPLLLWLNLLAYVLLALVGQNPLNPTAPDLVRWGANFTPLTLHGQPWRLLTSCFLHGGPGHLLMNMSSLVFLGLMTESLTGRGRLLLVYLLSGVGGGLLSLWWHSQGVLSVGASGAIFGLYGLLLATLAGHPTSFDRSARRTVLVLVFYLMASSLAGGLEAYSTDNAAHVGGLLTGFVLGWIWPGKQVHL
ncbi:rhomboid family intramembrane serine protease [Hymenobacter taeanensis]|uniref:Rhomboid family intramembrane serine protease n=1 Tax=Hymenobacter taeanensis TaxID=2735321 RepID=A0A6M6BER9_9BACT|nr:MULTISPECIES: rhomboid family intramembrane serine protease [Hymenobacter]QJX45655.1 rhomboid family intramembrane serine protease [Hymenobacter taeanensis]UOQ79491.1 rhomboid family intramembrane serine protease [Hymenobacter sp. 5414T-23]